MTKSVVRRILTTCIMLAFMGTVVSFSLAGPASGEALIVEKGIIKSDTVWEKEVVIKGDVEIAQGATLIVMPGTVVRFVKIDANGPADNNQNKEHHFPRAELIVRGRILAQGTRERMISFTSAEDSPRPADWGAINLLNTTGNVLEFCEVSHANMGLHCHGGQVTVTNCYFHDNGVAMGQKNVKEFETKSVVSILYNRITGNGGGILFGKGTSPTIIHNEIRNNKFFGIYGKKAGAANVRYNNTVRNGKGVILFAVKGFRLRENNISDNKEYNISLLEGQIWDVDARNNWWGTTDEKQIKNLIWDKDEDDSLGKLDFSDFSGS
ncbi:MAG: right-handed parallel beta-helix repeat-containing protein, partial [Desulfobulbaceae bacterium]|nr:right-handed parallel beta-helix repeat-containing protein [Desulfobulbaceae bacterium]